MTNQGCFSEQLGLPLTHCLLLPLMEAISQRRVVPNPRIVLPKMVDSGCYIIVLHI